MEFDASASGGDARMPVQQCDQALLSLLDHMAEAGQTITAKLEQELQRLCSVAEVSTG